MTLCLPQDVQAEAFDFPLWFFERRVHQPERPGADPQVLQQVVEALRASERPVLVAGGGVHYSGAVEAVRAFAAEHAVPVVETSAGKGTLAASDPMNAGGAGVVGVSCANQLLAEADMVLTVGSRLSDFTTGSRTVMGNQRVRQININVARFDAIKHNALALQADAKRTFDELAPALAGWRSGEGWQQRIAEFKSAWAAEVQSTLAVESALPSGRAGHAGASRLQRPGA